MSNKSHRNSALRTLNEMRREHKNHSSHVEFNIPDITKLELSISDCLDVLAEIPDNSIQLILIDPPYNLDIDSWDTYDNYIEWAKLWINEAYRVLSPNGNCVIFGGTQFQDVRTGDLIEILYYTRHYTKFRLVNTIIWHYKNGMSAYRYFANRHEEMIWLTKSKKYYFDLDSVRIKYDKKTEEMYLKDKRLNPDSVRKGKNPTNVWEINRLNGNAKERVGHPTQKPIELIRRLVKSLSYPGSTVLDFFAGSGTTGRACIEEKRNVILGDNDPMSSKFLDMQLKNMKNLGCKNKYIRIDNIADFFNENEIKERNFIKD